MSHAEAEDYIATTEGLNVPDAPELLPSTVLTKDQRPIIANAFVERFLDRTDAVTAFVLSKQAEEIMKEVSEQLKDRALLRMQGNKMEILGAEIATRAAAEYEYHDEELAQWEADIEAKKKLVADRKASLRKDKVINGLGEVCTATKTRDGQTLVVKFK